VARLVGRAVRRILTGGLTPRRTCVTVALLLLGLFAAAWALKPRHVPADPVILVGRVTDPQGPVAGALVRFQGRHDAVFTRRDGRFALPLPPDRPTRLTAWKEGYLIAGARADSGPLEFALSRLPAEDYQHYAWVGPAPDPARERNCGNCHGEIYREWSASGHARSVSNRHFLNLYDGSDWHGRPGAGWNLLAERPDGTGVCTACHAPTVTSFNDPAYLDLRQSHGIPRKGVHCDYCHKVAAVDDKHVGLTHGRFGLKLLRPTQGQLFFGPLDDVDRHEDTFMPVYRESRYCASCHEGTVFGVHVYGTYSEWQASPAARQGKQCQTCHMAPTGKLTNIAPGKGGIARDPKTLANHRFFAGSRADMLRQCLKVSATQTAAGDGVDVEVAVTADQVGHRVPTGFVDRNLLLVVEGLDAAGRTLAARRGPVLPPAAGARLAGRSGRLYAKLLKDDAGHSPVAFWRADPEALDTRLFPERTERSTYVFPANLDRVRVRLLYRQFWQEVAVTKGWPDNETAVVDRVFRHNRFLRPIR